MQKQDYDRHSDLKAFDDTKVGVKGLVDAGVTKILQIFVHNQAQLNKTIFKTEHILFSKHRFQVIEEVRDACENWGFFSSC